MKSLKYFVMAALTATAMPLYADMLYWMVDNPEDTWNGGLVNFVYATISAQDADDMRSTPRREKRFSMRIRKLRRN